jgi:S-DNA-T family DNA segregation ATPase FtsK/SpoIIIE
VLGSVALWAITGSSSMLVFALLGPLIAVASLGDAAVNGRRTRRRERARFDSDVVATAEAIAREHERERRALAARHPNVLSIQVAQHHDADRWRWTANSALPVLIGAGEVGSELVLGGDPPPMTPRRDDLDGALDRLRGEAAVLRDAAVVVDARAGIGICGPAALAHACARGILLQLADALSPRDVELVAHAEGWLSWVAGMPHRVVAPAGEVLRAAPRTESGDPSGDATARIEFRRRGETGAAPGADAGPIAVVAVAVTVAELSPECRVIIRIEAGSSAELHPRAGILDHQFTPEYVSEEQARVFAGSLAVAAAARGLASFAGEVPQRVTFESLYPGQTVAAGQSVGAGQPVEHSGGGGRDALACAPVAGSGGPVLLDLVRDGPHALVGGTTGSGKSELLVSWVLAMAASHSPAMVNFLLVDFKGGSSFAGIEDLPHVVGLITDLDERSADRALASLLAELRYRERAIADAGVRSIEQLPPRHPLARLVIVVDEFAAMVQDFPELHQLFGDLASRGRSLGVHLILCTQRPAGVVRDAVLANCAIRVSLRVNNRADSTAVIGTAAAAELPRAPLGRAYLALDGGGSGSGAGVGGSESSEATLVQVALADRDDIDRVLRLWADAAADAATGSGAGRPRRPWCDRLPTFLRLDDLESPHNGIAFGLTDLPHEQRQCPAVYLPSSHGNLMVVGATGSGKSGMLDVLAAADSRSIDKHRVARIPSDVEGAWDAVCRELAAIRTAGGETAGGPRILLLDDLDSLLDRFPDDHAQAFAESLTQLLREGGAAGVQLVMTARRLTSALHSMVALCDSRLVLRLTTRQEHLLAGGEADAYDRELPPGGGEWFGHRVQLAVSADGPGVAAIEPTDRIRWSDSPGWLIVSSRPTELARRLRVAFARDASDRSTSDRDDTSGAVGEVIELGETARSSGTVAVAAIDLLRSAGQGDGRFPVVLADAETWQSHWGLIGSLRSTMPVIFDGCSVSEFRVLSRIRQLPPPISPAAGPASGSVWLLGTDGVPRRAIPPWRGAGEPGAS